MKKSLMSKAALSAAGLVMILGLAGCGSSTSSSKSSSNSASSSQVTLTAADKAYNKANNLITEGSYQKAYNLLDNVENTNKKVEYLESDLENYLDARKDYDNGNYRAAEAELPGMKSSSKPMKKAYKALRTKIVKAINGGATTSSTKTANGQSTTKTNGQTNSNSSSTTTGSTNNGNSATTTSGTTQTPANAAAAKATSEDVISNFANKNGFNKKGYGIIPVSKNGSTYRFEVRQDNSDNTVANMVGIYEYNSSTGSTTKVN